MLTNKQNFRMVVGLVAVVSLAGAAHAAEVEVGAAAPVVEARDQDGQLVKLGEAYGAAEYTVVYFYPKADTPGCTKQACSLRDAYARLTDAGVQVFGVSHDTPEDQKAFKEKFKLPFTLLADPDGVVTSAFGVPSKGRFANREAFLVKDGKIVWRDTSASTAQQADDVLAAIAELGATAPKP